ncbi:substrate-binding periplasmic protein [Rhodovibrio salinarum]|uniref:Solute-binding protein family 3/N-terminal domain-containing protein n=1 Tax=Rhodovibrio salinarum TaxID=1087 RepID=A0A934QL10_9PROT|nr:transporter substrate-binding domain-containing protein [Rhodovibrio salinarum]MBK1698475.1 hypothetical protein [Rhodovibrio salinarum]
MKRPLIRMSIAVAALVGSIATAMGPAFAASPVDKLSFYSEQYPPFNYQEDGEPKGISIDLLEAILKEAGAETTVGDVQFAPWARGYDLALNRPGTVLFATTRTAKREDKFLWVGPITATRIGVLGAQGTADVSKPTDLNGARTATIRDDVAEQLLTEAGVSESALMPQGKAKPIVRLLEAGRADYWAYETNVAQYLLDAHGAEKPYEVKYVLSESELYFALNKETPQAQVTAFREAYQAVVDSGRRDEIVAGH